MIRTGAAALIAMLSLAVACGDSTATSSTGDDGTEPTFEEKDWTAEAGNLLASPDWYRHAVAYEVYVRSYQDSDGDGIGDLPGLTSRLDHLKGLGVDAIWLMPIMPTPFFDSGYDVADYREINPDYGTLEDFDALLAAAHQRGIRVIIDLVLNHTSIDHEWFQASRSDPTGDFADYYVWSDTPSHPDNGCGPQNPVFGDEAWTFDEVRQQYYFHRFYPEQPDLNYRESAVVQETIDVARFWLDRGVDGFRCDVIGLLHESADECELLEPTKDYIRELREVVDEYPGRVLVAEPSDLLDASPYFGSGSDMFHIAFDFGFGYFWGIYFAGKTADPIEIALRGALEKYPAGAQDGMVIGSHDVKRAVSTANGDDAGHRRAAIIQMTARGTPFIYYGEELGLRPGTEQIVDSRDTQRTPMLWSGEPGHGFTTGSPWIAFGAEADTTHLAAQDPDPASMLSFYRELLALRRGRAVWGTGQSEILDVDSPSIFATRRSDDFMSYLVAVNLSPDAASGEIAAPAIGDVAGLVLGEGTLAPAGDAATVELPAKGYAIFRTR